VKRAGIALMLNGFGFITSPSSPIKPLTSC
jgi:hypothetical protein